jgi:hypothetical protein
MLYIAQWINQNFQLRKCMSWVQVYRIACREDLDYLRLKSSFIQMTE